MLQIPEATGAAIRPETLKKDAFYDIREFGASEKTTPNENTRAINQAIQAASEKGGCVVIPEGEYRVYTIHLKSNVNLKLEKNSVLRAAKTDIRNSYEIQEGEGGNYEEPEVNRYAGLQDHGHSYFANSLFYGADIENVMIYGEGRIDGSSFDEEGYRTYTLMGGDPFEAEMRNQRGHNGEWFGNKAIALVRCKNIVLESFSLVIGGHFAIIAEGVTNLYINQILVDTTRDALDLDCCQDVTVLHSTFNSLTDDGLVMKSSFGAGLFMPTRNVRIEDCVVCGYDAGSVYAGTYTRDKLIATDRCGPTGRVKFGTESTCGYDLVTIRRVRFDRCRGFAMEAVDGSDLSNVIFADCEMDNVSSSPFFIRVGDRGRFPVTGNSKEEPVVAGEGNVRLDNRNWVLPDTEAYQCWPARRFTPSYRKEKNVSVDGHSSFSIVDPEAPVRLNPANYEEKDGTFYKKKYEKGRGYVLDEQAELKQEELPLYANANGSERIARVYNIAIENVTITNADPRYPIIFMGLEDSHVERVSLKNISVEYRGGLKMEHAVEQRQLNTSWEYAQFETRPSVQTLPWLVNPFFLKDEGLLPRVDWNESKQCWVPDPYNVPELPGSYPEPSNWGILPAYGLYARHVDGLSMERITFSCKAVDERHAFVLDDVSDVCLKDYRGVSVEGLADAALVTNHFKRPTNLEYIPDYPYHTTTVQKTELPETISVQLVTVNAPAPGTPSDSLYSGCTVPIPENGYSFAVPTEEYPLPKTVFRPFFVHPGNQKGRVGETLCFPVIVRNPAVEASEQQAGQMIYNELQEKRDYTVKGQPGAWSLTAKALPEGAVYDVKKSCLSWTPQSGQEGTYCLCFVADDGVIPETMEVTVLITA